MGMDFTGQIYTLFGTENIFHKKNLKFQLLFSKLISFQYIITNIFVKLRLIPQDLLKRIFMLDFRVGSRSFFRTTVQEITKRSCRQYKI